MTAKKLRIALVVPHIFMQRELLPQVIFSPGQLALSLADGLTDLGCEVTLYTPGPVATRARNVTADLSLFEQELAGRGDGYLDLLKKHPFTFVTLARQVQSEIIAHAYADANAGKVDLVHVYTNEEDTALPFAQLCTKPVVFTHHDPYNFLVKYKSVMPKYKYLNWVSLSYAQRSGMPADTRWAGTVYHGLDETKLTPVKNPSRDYFVYMGRIIEPKGVHLAIMAVRAYNKTAVTPLKLKIAGKHYGDSEKKSYWESRIHPQLDDDIRYVGFLNDAEAKQDFLGNAAALIVPSIFDEPFGMVAIEAMACGAPVIALDSGALPEIVTDGKNGFIAQKVRKKHSAPDAQNSLHQTRESLDEEKTADNLQIALAKWREIDRAACRHTYKTRFTARRMCQDYLEIYSQLVSDYSSVPTY